MAVNRRQRLSGRFCNVERRAGLSGSTRRLYHPCSAAHIRRANADPNHILTLAQRHGSFYMDGERLVRAGASPTWSEPEGSSHNESRLGRYQSLTTLHLAQQDVSATVASEGGSREPERLTPQERSRDGHPPPVTTDPSQTYHIGSSHPFQTRAQTNARAALTCHG